MLNKNKLLLAALLMVSALLGVACGSGDSASTAEANSGDAAEPTAISVQLSWLHNIEFGGFYEALEQGYYGGQNLAVALNAGGFDANGNIIDSLEEVTSGRAHFGVINGTNLLQARASGEPVMAVAAIYQRNPFVLISLAEADITRPQDLVGKTVQVAASSTIVYQALLTSLDIDPESVNEVERTDFTIAPLVNGEADVMASWVTNELVSLTLEGYETNLILAADYGIDVYPNVIFTTEALISENPDLVDRFLRATIQGMQYAIENPDHAASLSVQHNPDLALESETAAMQNSLPLINPAGSNPGMMTAEAWQTTHDILLQQGILETPLAIEEAYTLTFINDIYADQ